MLVWIRDTRSDADVLVNPDMISSIENDHDDLFHIRMANGDTYTVVDRESAAWLTMRKS